MIIDFHTHIFPEKIAGRTLDYLKEICQTEPYTDGTAKDLIRSQKEAGVDISVALPAVTKPSQVDSINRFVLDFQEGPILSFGGIHPACENYKEILKGIKDAGIRELSCIRTIRTLILMISAIRGLYPMRQSLGLLSASMQDKIRNVRMISTVLPGWHWK